MQIKLYNIGNHTPANKQPTNVQFGILWGRVVTVSQEPVSLALSAEKALQDIKNKLSKLQQRYSDPLDPVIAKILEREPIRPISWSNALKKLDKLEERINWIRPNVEANDVANILSTISTFRTRILDELSAAYD